MEKREGKRNKVRKILRYFHSIFWYSDFCEIFVKNFSSENSISFFERKKNFLCKKNLSFLRSQKNLLFSRHLKNPYFEISKKTLIFKILLSKKRSYFSRIVLFKIIEFKKRRIFISNYQLLSLLNSSVFTDNYLLLLFIIF